MKLKTPSHLGKTRKQIGTAVLSSSAASKPAASSPPALVVHPLLSSSSVILLKDPLVIKRRRDVDQDLPGEDDFFNNLLGKIQLTNYPDSKNPDTLPSPKDLLEQAIDNDFSLDLFSKEHWPVAQNIIDWCYNPEMLSNSTKPFAKQFQVMAHFCGDVCYNCSDVDYIFDVPVDAKYGELMDRFVLLNRGVCPSCHMNRTEMLSEWITDSKFRIYNTYDADVKVRPVPPNEMCSVWGQRSGKSHINATFLAPYHLHRYLAMPSPMAYYNEPANKLLEMVFVAPTLQQVNKFAWNPFVQAIVESPWFRYYTDYCKVEGRRLGTKLFRAATTFLLFPNKRLICHMAAANSSSLRGGTRVYCLSGSTLVNSPAGLLGVKRKEELLHSGVYLSKEVHGVSAHTVVGKKKVMRLTLRRGYSLTATPEHRVKTLSHDLVEVWKRAGELKLGDYVALGIGAQFPDRLPLSYVPKRLPKRELQLFEFISGLKEFCAKDLQSHPTALRGVYGITHDLVKRGMLRKEFIKGKGKNAGCRYVVTASYDLAKLRHEVLNHQFRDRDNAVFPTEMTEDLGYLLGYYVSEGSYAASASEFIFANTDKRVVDHFVECFIRTFGITPRVTLDHSAHLPGDKKKKAKPCYKVSIAYSVIKEFFRYLGMNPSVAPTKSIPWAILQAPRSVVLAFLSSYIEGDGSITRARSVIMSSTSKKLLKQIQLLLLNLRIISSLTLARRAQCEEERIPGKVFILSNSYALRLDRSGAVRLAKDLSCVTKGRNFNFRLGRIAHTDHHIPYLHPYVDTSLQGGSIAKWVYTTSGLNSVYDNFALQKLKQEDLGCYRRAMKLIDRDIIWLPVTKLKYLGVKTVYDLAVDSQDHAFLANGIVVHNSALDELGWFNTTEDGKKRTNSKDGEEVYTSLQRSMVTLRAAASDRRKNGDADALDALMINLSSPSSQHDPIMKVAAKAPKSPRIYFTHFTSFEVNPKLDEDEIREECGGEPERFSRDYLAIPPAAVSPFFNDKQLLLDRTFKSGENEVRPFEGFTVERAEDGHGLSVLRPVLNGLRGDKHNLRILTIDNGEKKNSFALCLSRYLPEIEGLLVEELVEVCPSNGRTIDLAWCHNQVVIPLVKHLLIAYVGYDRWNSGYSFYDLRLGHGVMAERYSLKWQDFHDFKEDLLGENIWFSKPEVSIEEILQLSDLSMRARYPRAHLLTQILTVNEFGRKVVKPDYGNDDLFRTLVLAHHFLDKNRREFREKAKKFVHRKQRATVVGVYRNSNPSPYTFRLPKAWLGGGFNYKQAMGQTRGSKNHGPL